MYPLVEVFMVVASLGSAEEGAHPLFLLVGGEGDIEDAGDGRRRLRDAGREVLSGRKSELTCFDAAGDVSRGENGLESPGTVKLKLKEKGIVDAVPYQS